MAVTGWVLVQTEVGHARAVCDAISAMTIPGVSVLAADTVTGQYDVIARVEATDADALMSAVENTIEAEGGVQHTVTCLAIHLG
ncbi:MAG: Lrp/AsnC ligand binding domain-containing protein [Gemmatimonadales bacterium]